MEANLTIASVQDRDPLEFYNALREIAPMHWDEQANGWLAAGFDDCRNILLADTTSFRHPDGDQDQPFNYISRGRRGLKTVVGEEHRRLHRWMLLSFSPSQMSSGMRDVIRNVVDQVVVRIAEGDEAELVEDFADRIPVRVICGTFGMPWDDDAWIARIKANLKCLAAYFNQRLAATEETIEAARAGMDRLRTMLDPYIEANRVGSAGMPDNLLRRLWEDGPSIFPNWQAEDVFMVMTTVLLAGSDTTTLAISNVLHLLLTEPDWKDWILANDDAALGSFVEEVLRLRPPVHYRVRRANEDIEIGGQSVRENSFVLPLLASANRDETHYTCPHLIDLDRRSPRDHLSFSLGPRACIGSNLARAEISEAIRQLVAAFPRMTLSANKPQPEPQGLVLRRYAPLHVDLGSRA